MPKFFVQKSQIQGDTAAITGGDVAHITRVLRLGPGDALELCDGQGGEYSAVIDALEDGMLTVRITGHAPCPAEPQIAVTLFQGIPKLAKMDYILEKCTELGVSRVVPLETQRCVARVEGEKTAKKLERWRKIVRESVKQCGRGVIPEVAGPCTLEQAAKQAAELDLALVAYENEQETRLRDVLMAAGTPRSVGVFIGPEGGFDYQEIELLAARGIKPVSLGRRILRTETAGHTVLTALMYQYGEL